MTSVPIEIIVENRPLGFPKQLRRYSEKDYESIINKYVLSNFLTLFVGLGYQFLLTRTGRKYIFILPKKGWSQKAFTKKMCKYLQKILILLKKKSPFKCKNCQKIAKHALNSGNLNDLKKT